MEADQLHMSPLTQANLGSGQRPGWARPHQQCVRLSAGSSPQSMGKDRDRGRHKDRDREWDKRKDKDKRKHKHESRRFSRPRPGLGLQAIHCIAARCMLCGRLWCMHAPVLGSLRWLRLGRLLSPSGTSPGTTIQPITSVSSSGVERTRIAHHKPIAHVNAARSTIWDSLRPR